MRRSLVWLACLLGPLAAGAEPCITVLVDSHASGQARLAAETRQCLLLLKQANDLPDYQLSVVTADLGDRATAASWRQRFEIGRGELPALAVMRRNGNKLTVENLIRRYRDPQAAAESAFRCVQTAQPALIKETAIHTRLDVKTEPDGAEVKVDGREAGTTPCLVDVRPGQHRLEVVHPDCKPCQLFVRPKRGETLAVVPTMEAEVAEVRLESMGPPVTVSLDGQPPRTTPFTLQVPAGTHRLEARGAGLYDFEAEFHAPGARSTWVKLTPVEARVRVGMGSLSAVGYEGYTTDSDGHSCPYQVTLDPEPLKTRVAELFASEKGIQVADPRQGRDCELHYQILATRDEVRGACSVVDGEGHELKALTCKREMPFLTWDEQGSADKRAREVVEDLQKLLHEYLSTTMRPSRTAPPGLETPLEVLVSDTPIR